MKRILFLLFLISSIPAYTQILEIQITEGQKMKAEAGLQIANAYLHQILKEMSQPDLTLKQNMLLNLALMEILRELERNEKTLNSTMQYSDNEIS
jgi:hypothetical protein